MQQFQRFYWILFLSKQKCLYKWIWKHREPKIKEQLHPNKIRELLLGNELMKLNLDELDILDKL